MNEIIHLSALLDEGAAMLEGLRSKHSNPLYNREQRSKFNQRYTQWYEAGRDALPQDLLARFEQEFARLPAVSHLDDQQGWEYYGNMPYALEEQQKQLFLARRRLWQPSSALPSEVRNAIAAVCRKSYGIYTMDKLFIESGCEQHWYVPTTTPDESSKAVSNALGWLDGILLYAPDQERIILHRLSEKILTNARLTVTNRRRMKKMLSLLELPLPTEPLAAYNLHPTVGNIAAPLLAINHDDEAILKVCIALNNAVQHKVARPDLDGSKLMQQAFSSNAPMIALSADSTEQLGWMQLYTGAIQALRNPRAHRSGFATPREETVEWLHFLSALFRALDQA